MFESKKIMEKLSENLAQNINMINFMKAYPIEEVQVVGESIAIKGTSDRSWVYLSSNSAEELRILKQKLTTAVNYAVLLEWMVPIISEKHQIKRQLSTEKLILKDEVAILPEQERLMPLTIEDAGFIYENSAYQEFLSLDYIHDRISKGVSAGVRKNGQLVAWGMTHDDGAIGFLHVLPEYRKRGYARRVTNEIILQLRARQELPFVHIEADNLSSLKLAASIGFERLNCVSWLELE